MACAMNLSILGLLICSGLVQAITPVESVIKLLQKLQKQTSDEGQVEAKTYDKFACFCKEQSDEKQYSIKTKGEKIALLTAEIKENNAEITKANQEAFSSRKQVESLKSVSRVEQETRDKAFAAYTLERADLSQSVSQCEAAIKHIKAATAPSLVQTAVASAIHAASRSDAFRAASAGTIQRLVALVGADELDSADIIQTITEMRKTTKLRLDARDAEESRIKHDFNMAQGARMNQIKALESSAAEMEEQAAKKEEEVQLATKDLAKTVTDKAADQSFLDDLTSDCEAKATAWDERSNSRAAELTAIAGALAALKSEVAPHAALAATKQKLAALAVKKPEVGKHGHWEWVEDSDVAKVSSAAKVTSVSVNIAKTDSMPEHSLAGGNDVAAEGVVAVESSDVGGDAEEEEDTDASDETDDDLEEEADDASDDEEENEDQEEAAEEKTPDPNKSFLQIRGKTMRVRGVTRKMFAYLKSRAKALRSTNLSTLALRMQEDHFVKVRGMIKDMIAKLEADASDETDQKQWCDAEMGKATGKRDDNTAAVEDDMAQITTNTAEIEQKTEEVAVLLKEIAVLRKGLNEATELRTTEHHENEKAEADATAGLAGVRKAMQILKDFYESLLQLSSTHVQPGNQAAASGIMAQLQVIKSDFERTIQNTQDQEADADSEYNTYKSDSEKELSEKSDLVGSTKRDITRITGVLDDAKGELKSHQTLKAESMQELAELKPACVGGGSNSAYIETVRRREAEIESLKNANLILEEMR